MTVVNCIDIESYLYGVVPCEIQSWSPFDALKCQAIVARNYTYCNLNKFSRWGFDLDTTVQTQIYKGYDAESLSTNKAVDETRDMILWYGNTPAQCFYFSSSGGHTEDVQNVWGSSFFYLRGVEDPYESGNSAFYTWEKTLTSEEVRDILKRQGHDIGEIVSIDIVKRSDAGRAVELKVSGTKGEPVTFYRGSCRTVFALYSQWFDVTSDTGIFVSSRSKTIETSLSGRKAVKSDGTVAEVKGNNDKVAVVGADGEITNISLSKPSKFTFTGRGYGHAVGLSQEGAKGFATNGKKFDEILQHYFPGTILGKIK